jgi:malate dehydrogenase (oxaloacetate-decarboxylating)(NADP+)
VSKAVFTTEVTGLIDEMLIVAARAVAEQVSAQSLATGLTYPPQSQIRKVSLHIAARDGIYSTKKFAWVPKPDDIGSWSRDCAYHPI